MIHITIIAGGWAKRYLNETGSTALMLPEGTTAKQAVMQAGLPENEIGMLESDLMEIPPDQPVTDGQMIHVYPTIIGG